MELRDLTELLSQHQFIPKITAQMKAEIVDEWTRSKTMEERESHYVRLCAVDDFARLLQRTLDDGKFQDRRIKE